MSSKALKRDPQFLWLWRMVSPLFAAYMFVDARLTVATSTVTLTGPGTNYAGAAVYVNWHKYVPFLCIHHGQHRRWLLMSSAPYLEPVAMWCRWIGLNVVRGAPGERSRQSLGRLIEALRRGESATLAADGPAGPPFLVKSGCVELARAALVPIIPVFCRSSKGKSKAGRWDQLYQVGWFDRIEVRYGVPVFPDPFESDGAVLERAQRGLEEIEAE